MVTGYESWRDVEIINQLTNEGHSRLVAELINRYDILDEQRLTVEKTLADFSVTTFAELSDMFDEIKRDYQTAVDNGNVQAKEIINLLARLNHLNNILVESSYS